MLPSAVFHENWIVIEKCHCDIVTLCSPSRFVSTQNSQPTGVQRSSNTLQREGQGNRLDEISAIWKRIATRSPILIDCEKILRNWESRYSRQPPYGIRRVIAGIHIREFLTMRMARYLRLVTVVYFLAVSRRITSEWTRQNSRRVNTGPETRAR